MPLAAGPPVPSAEGGSKLNLQASRFVGLPLERPDDTTSPTGFGLEMVECALVGIGRKVDRPDLPTMHGLP